MFTQEIKIGDEDCRIEGETLEEVCEDARAACYIVDKYKHDKMAMARAYPKIRPLIAASVLINGILKAPVISSPETEEYRKIVGKIKEAFAASKASKTEEEAK